MGLKNLVSSSFRGIPSSSQHVLVAVFVLLISSMSVVTASYDSSFNRYFKFADWCKGQYTCKQEGDGSVAITAHWNKVGAFRSYSFYQYGIFSARMKMPSGYSGGVVPCMYLISGGDPKMHDIHDEIDFEFLGGSNPRDMTIHTNLISGGMNNLEQFRFPFDPSADWHTYTIVYSPDFIVWKVDATPIRITWKTPGKPFPSLPLEVKSSIWDASSWSPLRADWSKGAVTLRLRDFNLEQTCKIPSSGKKPACVYFRDVRRAAWMRRFTPMERSLHSSFRKNNMKASYGWKSVK